MIDSAIKKARAAVLAAFFINGVGIATWVSRIPAVQTKLSLSEAELGMVLLGTAVGVLVALSMAGGLVARLGSTRVILAAGTALCVLLIPLALMENAVALWFNLFASGAAISTMDVAMNDQAAAVERLAKRPMMSSFHATYSVGGLVGALVGAGMAAAPGVSLLLHFLIVAVVMFAALLVSVRYLLPSEPEEVEEGPVFRLPERALWLLGAVAFCSSIGEGAMADWSGVYLNQVLATTAARFLGDAILGRWPAEDVVRVGGGLSALGLAMIIFTNSPVAALVGFTLVGFGLANIVPVAFSSAGNFPGIASSAGIAGVATIGYAGFLAGPPVIGLVAEATSLRVAFILVAVAVGSLLYTARGVSKSR
jgi:fucose permease